MFSAEFYSQGTGKQELSILSSNLDYLLADENIRLGSASRGSMTGSDSWGMANESTSYSTYSLCVAPLLPFSIYFWQKPYCYKQVILIENGSESQAKI